MPADPTTLYLDLLKRTLTRYQLGDDRHPVAPGSRLQRQLLGLARAGLRPLGLDLAAVRPSEDSDRENGRDQPLSAETMVGMKRLRHLEECLRVVVAEGVPGDVLEAGVWRGGAVIFMRAVLEVLGDGTRTVWAADSFRGMPAPSPSVAADRGDIHHLHDALAVGLDEVKDNFRKYGLLDDRVRFLKGWFADTLPSAPIEALALLRVDGDMYASTMDTLVPLYPKVSEGGFVIIDDYGAVVACRQAVDDFRRDNGIDEPMTRIDWTGVCWRKGAGA